MIVWRGQRRAVCPDVLSLVWEVSILKRVMHLLASHRFSGAENVICQIMSMFSPSDDVEMIYCSPEGEIRQALVERNLPFLPLAGFTRTEIQKAIECFKPDVIHAHDMRASVMAAAVCGRTKLICHIHNNSLLQRDVNIKSMLFGCAAAKAKHIFWVSQSAYNGYVFRKWFQKKSSVLCNIVDVDQVVEKMRLDADAYNYDVVYLGRLTFPKNPQRLLNVFEKVVAMRPDATLGIIGTGELEQELRAIVEARGLKKNVSFLGFQSNPYKILHDAKIMLMTSRWEGLPMCVLESMVLGVPVVSTPTDGVNEVVQSGENGFLGETDEALVAAVIDLLDNEEKRALMGKRAQQHIIKAMDKQRYKAALLQAYEE